MKRLGWLLMMAGVLIGQVDPAALKAAQLPVLAGTVAYIGSDQNVYTLSFPDNRSTALTSDADSQRLYRWPTWSTDGRLAYFATVRQGSSLSTETYVSPDGRAPGRRIHSAPFEFLNYAFWAPQNCADGSGCRHLALLMNNSTQPELFVRLVSDSESGSTERIVGSGRPFYFSWSPDGRRMLWQRNNQTLDIYDATMGQVLRTLELVPGWFQAPAWSPIDDRLLFGILNADQETTDLVVLANDSVQRLATAVRGRVAFSWSPNGNYIAYADRDGPLRVIDANSGELISRSPTGGIVAFFWSPDSSQIAYVTPSLPPSSFSVQADFSAKTALYVQDAAGASWSVLDVKTGANRRFGAFLPTQEMVYFLVYFDQFAQSHRLWSPDSRYLVYAEVTPNGDPTISLLDTRRNDVVPVSIADGPLAIWSFE